MNPLCCIAPVSIDRDRSNPSVVRSSSQSPSLGFENSVKNVGFGSNKQTFSAQVSSVGTDYDFPAPGTTDHDLATVSEVRDPKGGAFSNGVASGSVAGILYKWVNYGKGWRSRWFMLEDGVLSYYKIHGPDKISITSAREKCGKVIGEESTRYMRKSSWSNGAFRSSKRWKPLGEIHLKV